MFKRIITALTGRRQSDGGIVAGSTLIDALGTNYGQDISGGGANPVLSMIATLERARNSSRVMAHSSSVGASALRLYKAGLLDGQGLRLMPRVLDADRQEIREASEILQYEWDKYVADPNGIDYRGEGNLDDLMEMIISHWVTDGEAFIALRPNATQGVSLEIIDPSQIPVNLPPIYGTKLGVNNSIMGIEINRAGRRMRYNLTRPNGGVGLFMEPRVTERIPANRMIHLFEGAYSWQLRGFPFFSPIQTLAQNEQLFLLAAVGAAQHSAQVLNYIVANPDVRGKYADDGSFEDATKDMMRIIAPRALEGNKPIVLPRASEVRQIKGNFPDSATEPFLGSIHRMVAVGLGLTPSALYGISKDLNYSTSRAQELPVRSHFRRLTNKVRTKLLKKVYRAWLARRIMNPEFRAQFAGALDVLEFDNITNHLFMERGYKSIDPQKDAAAIEIKLRNGLVSKTQAIIELGSDPHETVVGFEMDERFGFGAVETPSEPVEVEPEGGDDPEDEDVEEPEDEEAENEEEKPEDEAPE